jgi:hypothetical protein
MAQDDFTFKGKLPKTQREVLIKDNFSKYVPAEIQQLKFFTLKGFKKQIKATISKEVSLKKGDLVPREIRDLRKLKPKALIRSALGPSLKQRAAMGVSTVIAQEAPILFLLLSKKRKKANNTLPFLNQTRTEVILIRRIQEGSATSRKQIVNIVKQQTATFKREQEAVNKQEKPETENVTGQKKLAIGIAGVSIVGMIALYGPALFSTVKNFLGETIPGIISQGLMGLSKPVQDFFEVFTSGKVTETFNNVAQSFEEAKSNLSSSLDRINPFKAAATKLEANAPRELAELKSSQADAELEGINKLRKEIEAADIDDEPTSTQQAPASSPAPTATSTQQAPKPPAPAPAPTSKPSPAPAPAPAPPAPAPAPAPPAPAPPAPPAPLPPQPAPPQPAPPPAPRPQPVPAPAPTPAPSTKPAPSGTQQAAGAENLAAVVTIQSGVQIQGLNTALEQRVAAMATDFKNNTGKKLIITSGVRSNEKQKLLWDTEMARVGGNATLAREKVAEPMQPLGNGKGSAHLRGLAIDISAIGTNGINVLAGPRDQSKGWLESFGLVRNVPGEDWHIQLSGTPPTPDNPTNPGAPIAVPDRTGGGSNVGTGEQIAGMSAEANRLRREPVVQNQTIVMQTTQTVGLKS